MSKATISEGIKYIENVQLNEAEDLFTSLLKEDKNSFDANFYLGTIAFKRDQYDKAITYLEKAQKINSDDAAGDFSLFKISY